MDLKCFIFPGWEPRIQPASARRDWMDASPESFAYRCLPLSIANSHGWDILAPGGCEVVWNGGPAAEDVTVRPDPGVSARRTPVALFGLGTVTFHVEGIFRTPPGWNLWAAGPPNVVKDGASPLSGLIETDWSPFTFTMNWKLTRPHHPVRFEANEPICFVFPVERAVIEAVSPTFAPIDEEPGLRAQFQAWSQSRDAFHVRMRDHPPAKPADKWQKFYYRGTDVSGHCPITDHQSKLHVAPFLRQDLVEPEPSQAPVAAAQPAARRSAERQDSFAERKYAWILEVLERQRRLSTSANGIFRAEGVSSEGFLDHHYATNRPLVIGGEISNWPAFKLWTPDYLREKLAPRVVEVQAGRGADADYERRKDDHRRTMTFAAFMDLVGAPGAANDTYITAYNSAANTEALAPLKADLGVLSKFLSQTEPGEGGMPWVGPAGTFTPLHHDLTNNLLVQIVGAKKIILAPPSSTPNLYNDHHVFSEIQNLGHAANDLARFPNLPKASLYELTLQAGDMLFIPIGWWHQVTSLSFSVTMTHTNFIWPNEGHETHPA